MYSYFVYDSCGTQCILYIIWLITVNLDSYYDKAVYAGSAAEDEDLRLRGELTAHTREVAAPEAGTEAKRLDVDASSSYNKGTCRWIYASLHVY